MKPMLKLFKKVQDAAKRLFCQKAVNQEEYIKALEKKIALLERIIARRENDIAEAITLYESEQKI